LGARLFAGGHGPFVLEPPLKLYLQTFPTCIFILHFQWVVYLT